MIDGRRLARALVLGEPVSEEPLSPDEWSSLDSVVRRERIEGYLDLALLDGRLAATDEQRTAAAAQLAGSMERSVAIEAMVGRVVDSLTEENIEVAALKGLAACRLDRSSTELRSFFDADLLVRPADLDRTYALLTELGFDRRFTEPRPGFDARFGKGSAFVDDERREIDLHRTLAMGSLGISVEIDELWDEAVPIEVAGRGLSALSPETRLLHACVHAAASIEPPRWHTLLDMREIDDRGVDADRLRRLVESWRYQAVIRSAVALHDHELGADGIRTLRAVADAVSESRLQRRTLAAYRQRGSGYASRSLLAVPVIRGWRDRAEFVRALIVPDRAYVDHHHTSRWERFRAAGSETWSTLRGTR